MNGSYLDLAVTERDELARQWLDFARILDAEVVEMTKRGKVYRIELAHNPSVYATAHTPQEAIARFAKRLFR